MAFEVLTSFVGNVERLRDALDQARAETARFVSDTIAADREIANKQAEIQRQLEAIQAKRLQAEQLAERVRQQIDNQQAARDRLELQRRQRAAVIFEETLKKTRSEALASNAVRAFLVSHKNAQDLIARNIRIQQLEERKLRVDTLLVAKRVEEQKQQFALDTARAARRVLNQEILDRRRVARESERILKSQLDQARASRAQFAGLGFSLLATGIPVLQAFATPITSFAFGGPGAAALATAGLLIGQIVRGFQTVVDLIKKSVSLAFDFSQQLAQSRLAIAGIIASTARLTVNGREVTDAAEKFNVAQEIAGDLQRKLLALIINTNITLEEANLALQTGLGFLAARGVELERAQDIIIQLTALAKNLGFEGARAAQQVRAVLTGTRSVVLGLLQSTGITAKQIRTLFGPDLANTLEFSLRFLRKSILESSSLLKIQIENVGDLVKFVLADAFIDAERIFANAIKGILQRFFSASGELTAEGQRANDVARRLFNTLADIFEKLFTPENVTAFVKALGSAVELLTEIGQITIGTLGFDTLKGLLDGINEGLRNIRANLVALRAAGPLGIFGTSGFPRAELATEAFERGLDEKQIKKILDEFDRVINDSTFLERLSGDAFDRAELAARTLMTRLIGIIKDSDLEGELKKKFGVLTADAVVLTKQELKDLDKLIEARKRLREILEEREPPQELQDARARVDAAKDEETRTRAIAEFEKVRAQFAEKLSELTKQHIIDIDGTTDAAGALAKVETEINKILEQRNKIQDLQAEVKAARNKKILLDEQLKSLEKIRVQTRGIVAEEDTLTQLVRSGFISRLRSAQASLNAAREEVELAKQKAKNAVNEENRLEAAKELAEAEAKEINARIGLLESEQSIRERLTTDLLAQERVLDEITDALSIQAANFSRLLTRAAGISGVSAQFAQLSEEIERQNKQFNTQQRSLERSIQLLNSLSSKLPELNSVLNAFGLAAPFQEGDIAEIREGLQVQLDLLRGQREEFLSIVKLQRDLLEIDRQREAISLNQLRLETQFDLIQARAEQSIIRRVDAFFQEQQIRDALLDNELQNQEVLKQQIAALELIKQQQLDIANNVNLEVIARDRAQEVAFGIQKRQESLNIEIQRSIVNATRLLSPFRSVTLSIRSAARELSRFFSELGSNNLSKFFSDLDRFLAGFKELFGGEGGFKGFLKRIGDIFKGNKVQDKQTQAAEKMLEAGDTFVASSDKYSEAVTRFGAIVGRLLGTQPGETNNLFSEDGLFGGLKKGVEDLFGSIKDIFSGGGAAAGGKGGFGGFLQGVGGVISAISGPIGAFITGAIGIFKGVFGFFSGIFTAAARRMAKSIEKAVENINIEFSAGSIELKDAISRLEAERRRTFDLERLKGGKDKAKKLRADIDKQLADLRTQQKDILEGFRFDLGIKRLGEGFRDFAQQVSDALDRVKEFLGAGGTLAEAQEFLSLTIKDLKNALTGEIATAQIEALQRAQDLLQLEQDREQLIADNEKRIRDILSEGLRERELTTAQRKSRALAEENDRFQEQLSAIEQQIEEQKALLEIDRQILGSTIDLNNEELVRAELLRLNVAERQREVDIIKQQLELLSQIREQDGRFFLSPDLFRQFQQAGVFTGIGARETNLVIQINGTQVVGGGNIPQNLLDGLLGNVDEILRHGGRSELLQS